MFKVQNLCILKIANAKISGAIISAPFKRPKILGFQLSRGQKYLASEIFCRKVKSQESTAPFKIQCFAYEAICKRKECVVGAR